MIPATVLSALVDRRLSIPERLVYRVALRTLSWQESRPLKLTSLAHQLRNRHGRPMHPMTISRGLKHLVDLGYLERGPNDGRRRTYLLRTELPELPPIDLPQSA